MLECAMTVPRRDTGKTRTTKTTHATGIATDPNSNTGADEK